MPSPPESKVEVKYLESVVDYLNALVDILFEKEYFGSAEAAKQYVVDMKNHIEQNIASLHKKPASRPFAKYGNDLYYVIYNTTKRTTWYIFFQQNSHRYLVRYITNNHTEGQYIR
jgi:hypothetical protein